MPAANKQTSDPTILDAGLVRWLVQQGIEGAPLEDLITGLGERACAAGIPLHRVNVTLRTHHPEFGAMACRWHHNDGYQREDFTRNDTDTPPEAWLQSPLYYLLENDIIELRQNLTVPEPALNFPFFDDLRAQGATDYLASKILFFRPTKGYATEPNSQGPKGVILSFTSNAPGGFSDDHLARIRSLLPTLGLALISGGNRQMAEDIAATYLGKDAGARVVSGAITRGSFEMIPAVIWYFDLQDFTKLSETLPGPAVIELLNDYMDQLVVLVESRGGNVLKFMGDGMLAIFTHSEISQAKAAAVEAAAQLTDLVNAINVRRADDKLTTTGFSLALHAGDVLYGNVGGKNRLDFTVIGPAVNTTARILGMCSQVDQRIVISSDVARSVIDQRDDMVSLGQYRLRGVSARQELFTLD